MIGIPTREPYTMRAPCPSCGCTVGYVTERGAQDVVRCMSCDRHCYNAPRTETGKAVRTVQTVHEAIKPKQRARILLRGGFKCECCGKVPRGSQGELHVGHVVSVKRGLELGISDAEINDDENLIAACSECNLGLGAEVIPVRALVSVLMARLRGHASATGASSGPTASSGSNKESFQP